VPKVPIYPVCSGEVSPASGGMANVNGRICYCQIVSISRVKESMVRTVDYTGVGPRLNKGCRFNVEFISQNPYVLQIQWSLLIEYLRNS